MTIHLKHKSDPNIDDGYDNDYDQQSEFNWTKRFCLFEVVNRNLLLEPSHLIFIQLSY